MKRLFYNKNTGDRIQNTVISCVLYTVSCILILLSATQLLNTYDKETEIVIVFGKASYIPYQDEYEKMLYPTVRITSPNGTGSGVVIESSTVQKFNSSKVTIEPLNPSTFELYVLTACHVVDNQSVVNVEFYNSTVITASVVITDTVKDLALLRCELCVLRPVSETQDAQPKTPKLYVAHLAPRNYTPYIFTSIYTVGCSLGLLPRPSAGMITAIDKSDKSDRYSSGAIYRTYWEVSSPILPGNSGGPVYDARTYEVIGIAVWVKVYNGQLITTMAGIVPIQQIYEFLKPQITQINTDEHK